MYTVVPTMLNFSCVSISWVVAFATVSAFNTSTQLPNAGDVIEFNDIAEEFGATTSFTGSTFTCPSTAFYFLHYRLLVSATSTAAQCRVDLIVGDVIRQVRVFNMYVYEQA